MDDPTLSGYGDNTAGPGGNVFGTGGGYARRRGGYGADSMNPMAWLPQYRMQPQTPAPPPTLGMPGSVVQGFTVPQPSAPGMPNSGFMGSSQGTNLPAQAPQPSFADLAASKAGLMGGGYASGGGYGPGLPAGGWSGGQMPSMGGYNPAGLLGGMLPSGAGAMSPGPQSSPQALSAPLQALLSAHIRRMMSGQGQAPQPPKANFAQMLAAQAQQSQGQPQSSYGRLGQPQQAAPAPFGQSAQFGGQGPPGGGAPNLMMNSPGP